MQPETPIPGTPPATPLPAGVEKVGAAPPAAPVPASSIPAPIVPVPATAASGMAVNVSPKDWNWPAIVVAVFGCGAFLSIIWYVNKKIYQFNDKQKESDLKMASLQYQISKIKNNEEF
jgi:hypothetical protein